MLLPGYHRVRLLALAAVASVSACRGTPEVARVQLGQAFQLLDGDGDSAPLRATAFDADGNALPDVELRWRSRDPDVVAVNPEGVVEARVSAGSTEVWAEVGDARSASAVVWVADAASGALLVDDRQIAGPTPAGAGDTLSYGDQFDVTLTDVAVPAPGTLVIARQSAPVSGRVVSARKVGRDVQVTLEVVGVAELFSEIDLAFDDSALVEPLPVPAASFDLAGFSCSADNTPGGGWPVPDFATALSDQFVVEREVRIVGRDATIEFARVALTGHARADLAATLDFPLTWQGALTCERELGLARFPFPGALAFVLAAKVPVGVGFVADGSFEATAVKYRANGFVRADTVLGFEYTAADGLQELSTFSPSHDLAVTWDTPVQTAGATIKAGLYAYLFAAMNIGHPYSELLGRADKDFKMVKLKAGVKGSYELTAPADQVHDPVNASSYNVALHGELSAEQDYKELLEFFGFPADTITFDPPPDAALLRSPEGSGSLDPPEVVANQPVTVRADLDPATVAGEDGYQVDAVHVWRQQNDVWTEVATIPAADGQTEFLWSWTPTPADETDGEAEFAWTTSTTAMPDAQFEIAPDSRERVGGPLSTRVVVGNPWNPANRTQAWVGAGLPYVVDLLDADTDQLPVALQASNGVSDATFTVREEGPSALVLDSIQYVAPGEHAQLVANLELSFADPGSLELEVDAGWPVGGTTMAVTLEQTAPYPTLIGSFDTLPGIVSVDVPAGPQVVLVTVHTATGAQVSATGELLHLRFTPTP